MKYDIYSKRLIWSLLIWRKWRNWVNLKYSPQYSSFHIVSLHFPNSPKEKKNHKCVSYRFNLIKHKDSYAQGQLWDDKSPNHEGSNTSIQTPTTPEWLKRYFWSKKSITLWITSSEASLMIPNLLNFMLILWKIIKIR